MPRRVLQLLVGLVLYGVGVGLTVAAGLGVDPWTVLAEGLSTRTGIGIGWVTNLLGALVLLAWIPLRQRPGVGTVANIALVGTSMQITLALLPAPVSLPGRVGYLAVGVATVAVASGIYIGARFGPGPRDGLMTGLHARLGLPIWLCRLSVEGTVLVLGWMLGGTAGLGTVVFALAIGPLVHMALPLFAIPPRPSERAVLPALPAVSARGTGAARLRA
ncbi:YitT family protein [Microbacterium sp. NPDC091313]